MSSSFVMAKPSSLPLASGNRRGDCSSAEWTLICILRGLFPLQSDADAGPRSIIKGQSSARAFHSAGAKAARLAKVLLGRRCVKGMGSLDLTWIQLEFCLPCTDVLALLATECDLGARCPDRSVKDFPAVDSLYIASKVYVEVRFIWLKGGYLS